MTRYKKYIQTKGYRLESDFPIKYIQTKGYRLESDFPMMPYNYLEKQCPYCGHPVVRHPDYDTEFSCVKGWVYKCTNPECDYDDSDYYLPTLAY